MICVTFERECIHEYTVNFRIKSFSIYFLYFQVNLCAMFNAINPIYNNHVWVMYVEYVMGCGVKYYAIYRNMFSNCFPAIVKHLHNTI